MVSKTRLYDAFGELIYAVAIADGLIQEEETAVIERTLADHPIAQQTLQPAELLIILFIPSAMRLTLPYPMQVLWVPTLEFVF